MRNAHDGGGVEDDKEPRDDGEGAEQDVLVVLKLSNKSMGTASEREQIETFAQALELAVTGAGVGEYDGDETGGGECTLFFCGPDAEQLLAVLLPLLKKSPLCRGGTVVRQADDPAQGEIRLKL